MKKLLVTLGLLLCASTARALPPYAFILNASSTTLYFGGDFQIRPAFSAAAPTIRFDGAAGNVTASLFTGFLASGYKVPLVDLDYSTITTALATKASTGTCPSGFLSNALTANAVGCAAVENAATANSTNAIQSGQAYLIAAGTGTVAAGSGIGVSKSGSVWTISNTASATTATSSTTANPIPASSGSNLTFQACNVAGSTLTITNAGSNERVFYTFTGSFYNTSGGQTGFCTLEINGQFPSGYNSGMGLFAMNNPSAGIPVNASFSFLSERLSATTISVCMACGNTSGGTWNIYQSNTVSANRASLLEVP